MSIPSRNSRSQSFRHGIMSRFKTRLSLSTITVSPYMISSPSLARRAYASRVSGEWKVSPEFRNSTYLPRASRKQAFVHGIIKTTVARSVFSLPRNPALFRASRVTRGTVYHHMLVIAAALRSHRSHCHAYRCRRRCRLLSQPISSGFIFPDLFHFSPHTRHMRMRLLAARCKFSKFSANYLGE